MDEREKATQQSNKQYFMPRNCLRFSKVNKTSSEPKEITSSTEILDFNPTPASKADIPTTKISENRSQVSKVSVQSQSESVSTLSNGSSSIVFDTYSTRWNLREAVKKVLFHKQPFINNKSALDFSEDNKSICEIILKELNVSENKEAREKCWEQIKDYIPNFLNKKRMTVVQAIKKKFNGKSMLK